MDKPEESPSAMAQANPPIQMEKIIYMQNCQSKCILEYKIKVDYLPARRSINVGTLVQKLHSMGSYSFYRS